MHKIALIFGTEHVAAYNSMGLTASNLRAIHFGAFKTEAARDAALKGADEGCGWTEWSQASEGLVLSRGFDPKFTAILAFGRGASLDDELVESEAEEGDGERDITGTAYTFATEDELKCFLAMVENAVGWMDYVVLEPHSLAALEEAEARSGRNIPPMYAYVLELDNGEQFIASSFWRHDEVIDILGEVMSRLKENVLDALGD